MLVAQLKALPTHEQADFAQLLRQMQEQSPGAPRGSGVNATSPQWPDFTSRLRSICGGRVVADSETAVSYGHGER